MYILRLKGYEIECGSIDELRAAVAEFADGAAGADPESPTKAIKPVAARSPPSQSSKRAGGPTKSWQMARWYAKKKGIEPTVARTELAKMRRDRFPTYRKEEVEFLESLEST